METLIDEYRPQFGRQFDRTGQKQSTSDISEVYLGHVTVSDFRKNVRGELGTRTATLHKEGIEKLRKSWIYLASP